MPQRTSSANAGRALLTVATRLLPAALLLGTLAAAPAAWARPLSLDLGLPSLSCPVLFGQASPPPPVVLPSGPAQPPAESTPAAPDTVRLKDGRVLRRKILRDVPGGLLFHDVAGQQTLVLPYGDVVDIQPSKAVAAPPATGGPTTDRRLFLEGQIREVQSRYDALSIAPAIEELIAGIVAIAGAVLFLYLAPGTLDDVFAALIGVPGALSLVVGLVELVSVVKREGELQEQLDLLRHQLHGVRSDALPVVARPLLALHF